MIMSKNFTPEPTTANGCTQCPAPVFYCVVTTANPVHTIYKNDAKRCAASFFLLSGYRRKQTAYGYHPLPVTNPQHPINNLSHPDMATTSSHFNTSYFMKKLLRRSGMLAMMLMMVSLFFVSNLKAQLN